jgi:hypothetical protein
MVLASVVADVVNRAYAHTETGLFLTRSTGQTQAT